MSYLPSQFSGIRDDISTISDGNMSFNYGLKEDVIENRKKFLARNRILEERVVCLQVQHGTKIIETTPSLAGTGFHSVETAIKADAIVTQEKHLALFLLTADCIPAIFYDQNNGTLCLAHLSRHNTELKFSQKIVSFLKKIYLADPVSLLVYFGPSIKKNSYVIPDYPNGCDLVGENINQLLLKGILRENIYVHPNDTATSEVFFSHYREIRNKEKEGRFATLVMLV